MAIGYDAVSGQFTVRPKQEVRSNLRALRHMLKILGDDWAFTSPT